MTKLKGILLTIVLFVSATASGFDLKGILFEVIAPKEVLSEGSFIVTLAAKSNQETFVNLYYEGAEDTPVYAGMLAAGDSKDFEIRASKVMLGVADVERIRLFKNGKEVDLSACTGSLYFNITAP